MTTQNRIKTVLTLAVVAMAILAASANAATMSSSSTAPDIGSLDIANYTGTSLDKWFCYAGEWAGGVVGQTITTGSDPVKFNAITYEIADTQKAPPIKTYTIRVCTVNRVDPGDPATWVLTEIYTETATQSEGIEWVGTDKAVELGVDPCPFMTWTLDEPVSLEADTEYGIDVGMNSTSVGWQQGIAYIKYSGNDEYADGTRYWSGPQRPGDSTPGGIGDSTMRNVSGERVFHIDMLSSDPNIPAVDAGEDMISWSGQAVPMDPNIVDAPGSDWTSKTYLWTAEPNGIGDPNLDVAITGADTENASVTVTKAEPTGDATVITMTLAVNKVGRTDPAITSSMTIDVYDDSCLAAQAVGPVAFDITDIDENCVTAFPDFALMAMTWLDDYALTGPVAK